MVIEAGGVTLRPWEPDDVTFVFDACQDADIQRWTTVPRPYTAADAVAFVLARPEPPAHSFAITRTDTGELLGSIGIVDVVAGMGEIGYWVALEGRGQGVASAALDALAQWSLAVLGLDRVCVRIAATNTASLRVAARAGFAEVPAEASCPDGETRVPAVTLVRNPR